ncbi:Protein CBG20424 [Caenorhabditis briggsae]|uniref:Protein CBG20424 n=3 Tax=Caenorhabditis briggsae TaxID=6238 RepID=A8XXR8_CAEBR|nr:Protein CBG20424 [Caenorhabditis briggsae]ULU13725.1 hypothetical protein L3Y34_016302 [Caenorhabditis briggsae]CAP37437.2 Protein CBG20424 [Caenorhabditis briggsae]
MSNGTWNSTSHSTTGEFDLTHIVGKDVLIIDRSMVNYPGWFLWLMIGGGLLCCLSCMVWIVSSILFLKKEKPCTHTVHIVVEKDPESLKRGSKSPKNEKDEQLESPGGGPMENGSFTNPLQPSDYGRSSKRSSRKEEEPKNMESIGGENVENSRKSSSKKSQKNEPESRKSSKKSSKKEGGSKKSNSKKSIKSERQDAGNDFGTTFSIQMDSDDNFQNSQKFGFFEKISRSIFQPRQ